MGPNIEELFCIGVPTCYIHMSPSVVSTMKRINSPEIKAQLKSRDPNCTVEEVLGNPVNKFPTDILFLKSTSYQLVALTCTGPSFLQKNGKPFVVVRTNSHSTTSSSAHVIFSISFLL